MEVRNKSSKSFYSEFGVTVNITRLTKDAKNPVDDCPLKWCVYYAKADRNNNRVYYSTGLAINKNNWDRYLSGSNAKEIKEIREKLQTNFDEVMLPKVKDLAEKGKFTFEALTTKLSNSVVSDVKQSFEIKIQKLISNDNIKNSQVYKCAFQSINDFHPDSLSFGAITVSWLNKYQKHMEAKGLRYTTIGMYMRTLRAIVNDAIKNEIISITDYPFGLKKNDLYQIPDGGGRDLALEMNDIKQIAEYNCPTKTIEMYRDLWIFSYLASGVNFGDILRFRYSNIKSNEIYFIRKKTKGTTNLKIEIIIPILSEMQLIIDKWGNAPTAKGYIFPFLNGLSKEIDVVKKIDEIVHLANRNIKKVTSAINKPGVSTYNCRHTFTTILAKKHVPESYIDQATGHAPSTMTKRYIGTYNKKERFRYNSMLIWPKGRIRTIKNTIIWKR